MMLQKVRSWLRSEGSLELDFEGMANGIPTVPMEGCPSAEFTAEGDLTPVASAAAEQSLPLTVGLEAELYVENTAPCVGDDPVELEADTEANAPISAPCRAEELLEFLPEALAHAPSAAPCSAEEQLAFMPEALGAAIPPTPMELEDQAAVLDADSILFPAAAASLTVLPELLPELEAVVFAAPAAVVLAELGLTLSGEAELWLKQSDWVSPVLKNNVLAITQAVKVERSGDILKIY